MRGFKITGGIAAVVLTLSVLFALPVPAHGQQLAPGMRVRIVSMASRDEGDVLMVGAFERLEGDTIHLTPVGSGGASRAIALADTHALEVSRGFRGHAMTGAIIGGLVGVVAGAVAPCEDPEGMYLGPSCDELRPFAVAMLGGGGVLVGALIGLVAQTEQWQRVPGPRITLAPTPTGRLGIVISRPF